MSSSEEESSEEFQHTQSSQSSQRRASSAKRKRRDTEDAELTEDIEEKLVTDLVRYIMCLDSAKLPIKRVDITSKVLSDYKKYVSQIFDAAVQKIYNIFRLELVEVERRPRVYILKNTFTTQEMEIISSVKTSSEKSEFIILMSVLSLIELSNGKIEYDSLMDGLTKMGIHRLEHKDKSDLNEKWFENIVKNLFVKQLYLEKEKDPGKGKEITYIVPGYRSKIEIGRLNVNRFISKCFGEELDEIRAKEIESEILESEAEYAMSQQPSQRVQSQSQSQRRPTKQIQSQQSQSQQTGGRGRGSKIILSQQSQSQYQSQSQCQSQSQSQQQNSQSPQIRRNVNSQSDLISKKSRRG